MYAKFERDEDAVAAFLVHHRFLGEESPWGPYVKVPHTQTHTCTTNGTNMSSCTP